MTSEPVKAVLLQPTMFLKWFESSVLDTSGLTLCAVVDGNPKRLKPLVLKQLWVCKISKEQEWRPILIELETPWHKKPPISS